MANARTEELHAIVNSTATLINEAFETWKTLPRSGPAPAQAHALDMFSAQCSHLASALSICAERCSDAASEMLDDHRS